jgi:hypothetical protein
LAIAAMVLYVSAGIGLFAHFDWWRMVTVAGSVISLVLFALYFNPWLSLAVLIDMALVWALLWAHWPSVGQVGA